MTDVLPKRMIEELIPLTEIGVESSKSVSYGDIHAIHTWFARRPLAACRAATFAALVDAPKTEAERDELLQLIVASLPGNLRSGFKSERCINLTGYGGLPDAVC